MTITVVIQKQTSGYYTARPKGAGVELGANVLTAERRTKSIDEAKTHAAAALTAELSAARIEPAFVFEIAEPAQPKPRPERKSEQ